MGGLAHYLEKEGLATTQISLIRKHTETIKPPRALWVSFELSRPFGKPNDADFQSRVLSAALDLLNKKEGPILTDYAKEADDIGLEGPWACPVNLNPAEHDLNETGKLINAFKSEMNQLRNWYDIAVEKRNRTTVGVSGVEVDNLADFLISFLRGKLTENPNPDYSPADTLNLATDDLKAFYTEAVTAQLGPTGTADELADWFYGQTAAGRLLYAIRDKGLQSSDEYFQIVAGHKTQPGKAGLNSHQGTKTQTIFIIRSLLNPKYGPGPDFCVLYISAIYIYYALNFSRTQIEYPTC